MMAITGSRSRSVMACFFFLRFPPDLEDVLLEEDVRDEPEEPLLELLRFPLEDCVDRAVLRRSGR